MKKPYVFDWLDTLIQYDVKPDPEKAELLTGAELNDIRSRFEQEELHILSRLKERVFKIKDDEQSVSIVKKYHDALMRMIAMNYDHRNAQGTVYQELRDLHEFIGIRLHQILLKFEKIFYSYLNENNQVGITELEKLRQQMFDHEAEVKMKLSTGDMGMGPVHVVMEVFLEFVEKIARREPVTRREAAYIQELFNDVLAIDGDTTSITGCPVLNELLIHWNLNSKTCIQYFTQGIEYMVGQIPDLEGKLEFLEEELKKVGNIPDKQGFVLNPDFPSVKDYCINWLSNEIGYLERKIDAFQPIHDENGQVRVPKFKIMCTLSIDQVGLLLRALDESRTLMAKSFNAVLKAIVPFLSTLRKTEISPQSVRTKAYASESRDIDRCLALLDDLKERISRY